MSTTGGRRHIASADKHATRAMRASKDNLEANKDQNSCRGRPSPSKDALIASLSNAIDGGTPASGSRPVRQWDQQPARRHHVAVSGKSRRDWDASAIRMGGTKVGSNQRVPVVTATHAENMCSERRPRTNEVKIRKTARQGRDPGTPHRLAKDITETASARVPPRPFPKNHM